MSSKAFRFTVISFEELLSLQFFGKELIFWLKSKDAARLKQCSKSLNKYIKVEDILIENEPLIFRRLVFQKKFDLLEKCIPFRINKQQKYPYSIEQELYKGFARIGNMKAIQNLISQSSIKPQIQFALLGAIESNQIEIVRFLLEKVDHLEISDSDLDLISIAYQLNRKEISILFLEYLSKKEKYWEKLFPLISLEKQKSNLDQHHFIDHLLSLSSIEYLPHSNLNFYLTILQNPNFISSSDVISDELLQALRLFPIVIPPILTNELEVAVKNHNFPHEYQKEKVQNYVLNFKVRWSVFVDDFDSFNSQLTSLDLLWDKSTQKRTLFELVIERTIDRNLKLDFFNHCLAIVKEKAKVGGIYPDGIGESFNRAIVRVAKSKRLDLFHQLINLVLDEKQNKLFSVGFQFPGILATFGEVGMLKEFIEHKERHFVFHPYHSTFALSSAISHQKYENMDFILSLPKSKLGLEIDASSVGESIIMDSNIDLLQILSNRLNFETFWKTLLRKAITIQDEIAVEYVLNYLCSEGMEKNEMVEFFSEMIKKEKNLKIKNLLNHFIVKLSQ